MPNIFPLLAALFLLMSAVLYFFPRTKLLNFVDYGTAEESAALNRYAARRFLLPALVSIACSAGAAHDIRLTLPLVFVVMFSILGAVIWISAGWRPPRPHT